MQIHTCNTNIQYTHPQTIPIHPCSYGPDLQLFHVYSMCVCPSSPPWVLSPPQPDSTFSPLHIPLLTETRSPSSFFPSVSPITLSLAHLLSTSFCYIDILSLPLYWDTLLTAPPVTLSMTTDLRGKCKVPPHQEIKTLASSRCLTPLTSLIFPHPFLYIPLPKSPLYLLLLCFLFLPSATPLNTVFLFFYLSHHILPRKNAFSSFSFVFHYICLFFLIYNRYTFRKTSTLFKQSEVFHSSLTWFGFKKNSVKM